MKRLLLLLVGSVILGMPGTIWATIVTAPFTSETGLFQWDDESGWADHINCSSDADWKPEFSTDSTRSLGIITRGGWGLGDAFFLIFDREYKQIKWGSDHIDSDDCAHSILKGLSVSAGGHNPAIFMTALTPLYSMETASEASTKTNPEPATIFLLGTGLIIIAFIQRKFAIGKLSRSP